MATVRRLTVVPEFRLCEEIHRKVWAFEDREIIPSNELIAITRGGGLVLGAFEEDRMVGFCFGFTGWANRKAYHCSRMLAVLPAFLEVIDHAPPQEGIHREVRVLHGRNLLPGLLHRRVEIRGGQDLAPREPFHRV